MQLYCNQEKTDVKKEHTIQISELQLLQRILDIYARTYGISDSVHFITSAAILKILLKEVTPACAFRIQNSDSVLYERFDMCTKNSYVHVAKSEINDSSTK